MKKIQERIKERRIALNLTLLDIAEYLGVKESTVQRYESGEIQNLKHQTIVKLSEILKCSPVYLMGWDDTPEIKKPTAYKGDGLEDDKISQLISTLELIPEDKLDEVLDLVLAYVKVRADKD